MLLITVLVATVMLLFLFLNYKNKFIYALSAQIMFVSLMMIVCVIYMSKVTQYKYYMHLDYQIYLWLHTLRMNFNSLTRIYNFCLAMFMITSVIYSKMFYKMHWLTVCILVVPIVLFLVFADRRVGYNIYMSYYSQGGAVSEFLIKNSLKICEIIFEIYLIMPVAFMALSLKKTKIFEPFYSTKPKLFVGGIGLSYVKNVVKIHGGEIKVKSKYGEYSEFQIAFPSLSEKKLLHWGDMA